MQPLFSLVVSTSGRAEELLALFHSLEAQSMTDFELIVVDQSVEKRVSNLCALYQHSLKPLYKSMTTRGVSRGRNYGLKSARGKIIAFPDDDCLYPANALEQVARFFDQHPSIDILSGSSRECDSVRSVTKFRANAQPITRHNVLETSVEFATFMRREVLELAKYDETFGPGCKWGADEGPDLLLRAIGHGFRAQFEPSIVIYHPCPIKHLDAKDLARSYEYGKGRGRFLRKHSYPLTTVSYSMFRSVAGSFAYLLLVNPRRSKFYWNAFRGKCLGYFASFAIGQSEDDSVRGGISSAKEAEA